MLRRLREQTMGDFVPLNEAKRLPQYPPDHKVGMVVPQGGSNCAKCKYFGHGICNEDHFVRWNGSGKLPAPPDRYCCDFFEQ